MPVALRPAASLGLNTPSNISRDLRTPSPRLSAVRDHVGQTPPISPLYLPTADGALSKICGSLVEPEDQRQRWACSGCKSVFPRDATIYLAPVSSSTSRGGQSDKPLQDSAASMLNRRLAATSKSQEQYCKSCYADKFSLGTCFACAKPVLGSTKEDGKYVKAGLDGHVWHGRCWRCTLCDASGEESGVCLGLDGTPVCAECFDQPRPRRNVVLQAPAVRPSSPSKGYRRITPPTASLSGNATRNGMGATIAELSRRFGHAPPASTVIPSPTKSMSPDLPQLSGRQSPVRGGMSRSNSVTSGVRPLTAQFSGQGFNLAAFQSSTPTLGHSDSRSRCSSPTKEERDDDDAEICAKCFKGPFEAPSGSSTKEARMVALHSVEGRRVYYHTECFSCAICQESLENAARSFVRLDTGSFAHPACAPPVTITRQPRQNSSARPLSVTSSASSGDLDHATHQRLPRPTLESEKPHHNLPTSYLMGSIGKASGNSTKTTKGHAALTSSAAASSNEAVTSSVAAHSGRESHANNLRRFQPTSGAAPPTRSTLLHPSRSSGQQTSKLVNASMAVSSGIHSPLSAGGASTARFSKLGGMQSCGGCNVTVSSLEGVRGPRGQTWHRKCLVCSAVPPKVDSNILRYSVNAAPAKRCGKQLDSSAKVTTEGELRCRDCYDRERSRHPTYT